MYNEKKGSFIQFLKKPLTWIILVLTIISCIAIVNLPALYAYFSDVFVAHTSTIQFSDLSVKIGDKIYSKPLVYATGADNVESNPYKTLIEFTDNSENNNNILLADGYTVPIKYTITNDSKVTENITPEIKFTSFINNTDITGSENIITKMFTITQLTYSLDGQGNTKLISTDDISSNGTPGGSNTIATFKGATTLVKASESIEVVFRIKHNRESVKRGSAPSYLSRLKIETTAVATLPNNSAPNWDAKSEAMPFAIATYAFTNPAVLTKSSFNSDNITLADNTVTVKGTASTLIANWRPAVYECIINRTDYNAANPSGVENEVGVVNPEGNTFAVTYTDINIPWKTDCTYNMTTRDDFGNKISSSAQSSKMLNGGFVEFRDTKLRDALKAKLVTQLDLDSANPITMGNYTLKGTSLNLNKVGISDLTGLQDLKAQYSLLGSIYLEYNDFTEIAGKLPNVAAHSIYQGTNGFPISLSNNPQLPTEEIYKMLNYGYKSGDKTATYSSVVASLYLSNTGITGNLDWLNNVDFTLLYEIGLSLNNITNVSALGKIPTLTHINLTSNTNLSDVVNVIGRDANNPGAGFPLPNLVYYNLQSCNLSAASKEYLGVANRAINFPATVTKLYY